MENQQPISSPLDEQNQQSTTNPPVQENQPISVTPSVPENPNQFQQVSQTPINNNYQPSVQSPININTEPSLKSINLPGVIVLQWLTYAFWGWTVLAVSALVVNIFAHLINSSNSTTFIPYGIAATIVLLPISIVCDVFYSKHEPNKKIGAATIVMVIHAVLFALFAVGSLIAAAISLVLLFTSSSSSQGPQISLYSSLVIFVLYIATLLRTLNPAKFSFIKRYYLIFMTIVVGLIAIIGFLGPVKQARITKNDTLIVNNLNVVLSSIDTYAQSNQGLPPNLHISGLYGDAQTLVNDNLVQYTPNTLPASINSSNSGSSSNSSGNIYYYQICVTYAEAANNSPNFNSGSANSNNINAQGYLNDMYLDVSSHPAGHVCYKLDYQSY